MIKRQRGYEPVTEFIAYRFLLFSPSSFGRLLLFRTELQNVNWFFHLVEFGFSIFDDGPHAFTCAMCALAFSRRTLVVLNLFDVRIQNLDRFIQLGFVKAFLE